MVGVAAISLETADLTPDSVDKILAHKSVKEKQAEYTNKLDNLRKKKRKEMGKLQEKLLRTPSKPKSPPAKFTDCRRAVALVAGARSVTK